MRLRNYQANRFSLDGLRNLDSPSGMLLVRSHAPSERILQSDDRARLRAIKDSLKLNVLCISCSELKIF